MKRFYIATVAICLAVLAVCGTVYSVWDRKAEDEALKVGFLYESDETTPYTYNFARAKAALEKAYGSRVKIYTLSNVLETEAEEPLRDMARKGCAIIFTNSNGQVQSVAREYPHVQFCQVSNSSTALKDSPSNYHTFNGKIYQGRYVSGIVAGMKLRQLIDSGEIAGEDALVGFVGAFPTAEVISGYTAFLLGIRSVAPEAVMRVRYTGTWSNYSKEKACAKTLIDEGCVIISQHASTIGPAVACEEAAGRYVYHIGYNQSMLDIAPTTSLISTRINWSPYILGAVEALMEHRRIEDVVDGDANGNDLSAGFDKNWVEMLELNKPIAAAGTQEAVNQAVEDFRRGKISVFQGDYVGVYAFDTRYTYDLRKGYEENKDKSTPTFAYILQDVIQVEN